MTEEKKIGDIVVEWYESALEGDDGAARAARARLRRCGSPVETLAIAETHELYRQFREHGKNPNADRLALLATTFARLRDIRGCRHLAALFGERAVKVAPRPLSELRFQSLIRCHTHRGLIRPLRRSLAILGSDAACNGRALAKDLYFWNEKVRNHWCCRYFGIPFAGAKRGETVQ